MHMHSYIQEFGGTGKQNAFDIISIFHSLDLHHEIEELRSKLVKSNTALEQLRSDYDAVRTVCESQVEKLQDEHGKLRDRYDR